MEITAYVNMLLRSKSASRSLGGEMASNFEPAAVSAFHLAFDFKDPPLSEKLSPKTVGTVLGVMEYAEIGSGPVVVAVHGQWAVTIRA
jgi:hypothetical protein